MTTRIEMLNRALLRIGSDPLQSEADAGAPVHLAVYDGMVEYLSGVHPWSFFRVTRRLPRLSAAPAQHYTCQHQLPPDRLGPIRALYDTADTRNQPTTAYTIEGATVLSNLPDLWCTFLAAQGAEHWPGTFREGFTLLLMSELALSIREDRPLRDKLRIDALGTPHEQPHGGVIGYAITSDGMAEPSRSFSGSVDNPLIDARW